MNAAGSQQDRWLPALRPGYARADGRSLEELLTHSQHAVDTLSQEMFAQTRRIEAVQQELARLMHKLDTMRDAMPQAPRDLLAEKPPHY